MDLRSLKIFGTFKSDVENLQKATVPFPDNRAPTLPPTLETLSSVEVPPICKRKAH